jgi:3-methyladenine DNA glycosylase Tag
LLASAGIVRTRLKIEAEFANARALVAVLTREREAAARFASPPSPARGRARRTS